MARYIDAEELRQKFNEMVRVIGREMSVNFIVDTIDKTPTADVVEVKHGQWLYNTENASTPAGITRDFAIGYKCSLCGRTEINKEPYCNCGAKMDGEKTNELS